MNTYAIITIILILIVLLIVCISVLYYNSDQYIFDRMYFDELYKGIVHNIYDYPFEKYDFKYSIKKLNNEEKYTIEAKYKNIPSLWLGYYETKFDAKCMLNDLYSKHLNFLNNQYKRNNLLTKINENGKFN